MRLSCFFLGLLFSLAINAQNNVIRGKVSDSTSKPLPYTSITLLDSEGNTIIASTISNAQGSFLIKSNTNGSFILRAARIGYQTIEKEVNFSTGDFAEKNIDFRLRDKQNQLDEIVVTSGIMAKANSDTLTFFTQKFTNGSEQVLNDVLKKLPGIEIESNGKIKAFGKEVDKLLIDGDDFYPGQLGLLTENLPAVMVGNVQVFSNYQENELHREFSQGGQTAINVNIKEKYRTVPCGNVSAAAGNSLKYSANANLYTLGEKLKLNLLGWSNNTGSEASALSDFSPSTGLGNMMMNPDAMQGMMSPGSNAPGASERSNAEKTQLHQIAFNVFSKPNSKITIHAILNAKLNKPSEYSIIERSYLNSTIEYRSIEQSTIKNQMGNFFLGIDYKPNQRSRLSYRLNSYLGKKNSNTDIQNDSVFSPQILDNSNTSNNFQLSQVLEFSSRLSKNDYVSVQLFQQFYPNQSSIAFNSDTTMLGIVFETASPYILCQDIDQGTSRIGGDITLGHHIKKMVIKNVSGIDVNKQTFESLAWQDIQSNGNIQYFDALQNDLHFDLTDLHTGLYLLRRKGFIQFSMGMILHQYISNVNTTPDDLKKLIALPDCRFELHFSDSHRLTFSYNSQMQLVSPNQLLVNPYIQSYYSMAVGDSSLNPLQKNYTGSVQYFLYDLYSNTQLNSSISYSKSISPVSTYTSVLDDYSLSKPIVMPSSDQLNGELFFNKRFANPGIMVGLRTSGSISNASNYTNQQLTEIKTTKLNEDLRIMTLLKGFLNFDIALNTGISKYSSNQTLQFQKQININPSANIYLYSEKGFSGNIGVQWSNTKVASQTTSRYLIGGSLRYAILKKLLEFSVTVNDLLHLNKSTSISSSYNSYYSEISRVSVLPGYILFGIKYKIQPRA